MVSEQISADQRMTEHPVIWFCFQFTVFRIYVEFSNGKKKNTRKSESKSEGQTFKTFDSNGGAKEEKEN